MKIKNQANCMKTYKLFFSFLFVAPLGLFAQDFLRWSDEFNGTQLDTNFWEYQIGDGCPNLCGWGNDERQSYQKGNIAVGNGMLNINAKKENIGNSTYSSGRIRSMNKFDFASGRIDVRARLPVGQAYWAAVWFLPTENYHGTWPLSG
jgi:beta-glucanase (GH16 family)